MDIGNFWNTVKSGLKKVGQFFTGTTTGSRSPSTPVMTNPNGVSNASAAAKARVPTQVENPDTLNAIKKTADAAKEEEKQEETPATAEEQTTMFDIMQAPRDTRIQTANEEDAARLAAYRNARNQGANRATASAMQAATAGSDKNYASNLAALRNTNASTQADYLQKMGYANALGQEAENIKKGQALNVASAVLQGAGSGATIGGRLFG